MLLLLLFISNFLIISVSTLPQTGTNDQALSFKDIYSSNIKGFSNDFGKTRLISADDSTVKNDNIANPFVAYDSHASIDEVDLSNPSDDLADRPTDLVSTDVASQKSPNCKSDLATRDEMDDSISGDSLGPISSKMRLTHKTRSGVPDSQCIPLEQEQSPPTATSERPKRKGNPPQGESVKREGWQQPNGQFEDRHKCMDGFGVVCCKNPITPVYFTGWTRLLGNSENCVWCKKSAFGFLFPRVFFELNLFMNW